ncbi:MAG: hypothetical protein MJ211_06875 [Bacteroidales bacterium]|nr:hypothetical protein [Bacteroidales bacterium]
MENKLYTKQEVINFIRQGKILHLSGSAENLSGLPRGKWIGGTSPYCVDKTGQVFTDKIYVDDLTDIAAGANIESLDERNIQDVVKNSYDNGFSIIILPIDSPVYYAFANNSLTFDGIFNNPVIGYVACCKFADFGKVKCMSICGTDGELTDQRAAVMHIKLPKDKIARTEIMNFDKIDTNSAELVFPKSGFVQSECLINGKPGNIADYLDSVKLPNGAFPQMITSMNGALVNRDIKYVNVDKGEAAFFSPVYENDKYYLIKTENDYQTEFNQRIAAKQNKVSICFACTSYFMLGDFEGKKIDQNGIYAFGEISYQLLNKTIVTLEIDDVK